MHLFLVKKEIISLNLLVQYSVVQLDSYMSLNRRYITQKTFYTHQTAHELTAALKHMYVVIFCLSKEQKPIEPIHHKMILVN